MSYVIDQISSSYKISEYLADRGIHPKKEHGDRKMYPCPLPSHTNDSHPSFYLFDKGDHEDFHCFGCKAGGGIIQFVSEFENISIKDSISKLASSLNLNVEDAIDHIVAELTNVARDVIVDESDLLHTSMFISRISHEHLRRCDFDAAELAACEKMFKLVDKFMIQQDQQSIEEISSLLPTHLRKRFAAYTKKKSAEERESMTSWDI